MLFVVDGPDFSIVSDTILCDGDTTDLSFDIVSIAQPFDVIWDPTGETSHDIEVSPNESTTYICTITDANDCITSDTLDLDVLCTPESFVDFHHSPLKTKLKYYFLKFFVCNLYTKVVQRKNNLFKAGLHRY